MGILSSKPGAAPAGSFKSYKFVKCQFDNKGVESGVGRDDCMRDSQCAWQFTGKDVNAGICKQRVGEDEFVPCPDIKDEFDCKHLSNQCEWSAVVQGCHMRNK